MKVYRRLAQLIHWSNSSYNDSSVDQMIKEFIRDYLPSGSGIDNGLGLDTPRTNVSFDSKPQRIVLNFGYHHMDDNGCYCGWTHHSLYIYPCLMHDYRLRLTGENYRDIKEHFYELFQHALSQEIEL